MFGFKKDFTKEEEEEDMGFFEKEKSTEEQFNLANLDSFNKESTTVLN